LDEAWRDGVPTDWSAQRVAICVLDAHGAPMKPDEVVAFVAARSQWNRLSTSSARYWHRGAAIHVRDDGFWERKPDHHALPSARRAVQERIATARRWAQLQPDPTVLKANRKHFERKRQAHAERLARMSRVLIHAFPAQKPEAIVLLDVDRREVATFVGEEVRMAKEKLLDHDIIAGVDVRSLLRTLEIEPGERRLGELGPPQKTKRLNKQGRTLRITTGLLVQGSCGISRPFGDEKVLRRYLRDGSHTKLRRRLEADAKSLFALYQYGRLHGAVRLRWGFLDEMIPAPWVHRDELTIHNLMEQAHKLRVPLEVVIGSAPSWTAPWSRLQRAYVEMEERGWQSWLVDDEGFVIEKEEIQLARLAKQS